MQNDIVFGVCVFRERNRGVVFQDCFFRVCFRVFCFRACRLQRLNCVCLFLRCVWQRCCIVFVFYACLRSGCCVVFLLFSCCRLLAVNNCFRHTFNKFLPHQKRCFLQCVVNTLKKNCVSDWQTQKYMYICRLLIIKKLNTDENTTHQRLALGSSALRA